MSLSSPVWPARLDHIRLDGNDPRRLAAFYHEVLGMAPTALDDRTILVQGNERRIVIGSGTPGAQPYSAFAMADPARLDRARHALAARGVRLLPSPTLLFAEGAFAVADPDGRLVVLGVPRHDLAAGNACDLAATRLPGRLQHVVVASRDLAPMLRFYEEALGFVVSDYVLEGEGADLVPTVGFFRSNPEHHSFAVFRCPETRPDHHSYEASSWNDLRDWADHMASLRIPLWWGPGRHGPGNNLFFMVKDPHGYLIEISAELEIVEDGVEKRAWKHEERTLNLWGPGFMRS
jgi:catechol 2,3-dioxygenase-like lactoylglutathione lyase family enzyme